MQKRNYYVAQLKDVETWGEANKTQMFYKV
jgi:hypothetical protein